MRKISKGTAFISVAFGNFIKYSDLCLYNVLVFLKNIIMIFKVLS